MKKLDLLLFLLVAVLFILLCSIFKLFNPIGTIDLTFYDTYFVVHIFLIQLLILSFLTFITFLVKQLITRYQERVGSIALIAATAVLLIILTALDRMIVVLQLLMSVGWQTEVKNELPSIWPILVIQITLVVVLIFSAYKLGQQRK